MDINLVKLTIKYRDFFPIPQHKKTVFEAQHYQQKFKCGTETSTTEVPHQYCSQRSTRVQDTVPPWKHIVGFSSSV